MIGIILDMLAMDEHKGLSNEIDIAKGKNKLSTSFKEAWKQYKREKAWPKQ